MSEHALPDWNGWERLIVPFFTPVCRRVLTPYLTERGFHETDAKVGGGLVYQRADVFFEISYYLETVPNEITLVLGTHRTFGRAVRAPLWFVKCGGDPDPGELWQRFRTEAELEGVVTRIRDELLRVYAEPLWDDGQRLDQLIARFEAWTSSSRGRDARDETGR